MTSRPAPTGVAYLLVAYLIWGMGPVYWKQLGHVAAFELVMQRTVWSMLFLLAILAFQRRLNEVVVIFRQPGRLSLLALTTTILATNWYIFIWAVNHDQVLQTSLGYYINPLITVFLAMIILKERLRRPQVVALMLAAAAVLFYTVRLGTFPWIALCIATTFAFYGLMHKIIPIRPLPALYMETLLLSFVAGPYVILQLIQGKGALFHTGIGTDLFIMGTCLVTGLPLLLFTRGTRWANLTTVGFMQYIVPCCSFLLAVFYYQEPFSTQKLITFLLIWTALMIYSVDMVRAYRSRRHFSRRHL